MPSRERTNLRPSKLRKIHRTSGNSESRNAHIICTGYTNPRAQARAVSRVCVSYPYRARDAVSPEIRARDS